MKLGKKVYIKELGQYGKVTGTDGDGKVMEVEIETSKGPELVNVIEKGYNIVTLIRSILLLLHNFLKPR